MESALAENFWRRSYVDDVAELNARLGKGAVSAGFVPEVRSVLTGEPDRVVRGGLMFVGLNPKWRGTSAAFQSADVGPTRDDWARGDFAGYRDRRATYFGDVSAAHYGAYFTRIARSLRYAFAECAFTTLDDRMEDRRFMRERVAKFDLLPWWSENIKHINPRSVSAGVPPIHAWAEVLRAAVLEIEPGAIIINGTPWREIAEFIFGCRFTDRVGKYHDHRWTVAQGDASGTPVLMHPHLSAWRGIGYDAYRQIVGTIGLS